MKVVVKTKLLSKTKEFERINVQGDAKMVIAVR
jgi:hypothetical protein